MSGTSEVVDEDFIEISASGNELQPTRSKQLPVIKEIIEVESIETLLKSAAASEIDLKSITKCQETRSKVDSSISIAKCNHENVIQALKDKLIEQAHDYNALQYINDKIADKLKRDIIRSKKKEDELSGVVGKLDKKLKDEVTSHNRIIDEHNVNYQDLESRVVNESTKASQLENVLKIEQTRYQRLSEDYTALKQKYDTVNQHLLQSIRYAEDLNRLCQRQAQQLAASGQPQKSSSSSQVTVYNATLIKTETTRSVSTDTSSAEATTVQASSSKEDNTSNSNPENGATNSNPDNGATSSPAATPSSAEASSSAESCASNKTIEGEEDAAAGGVPLVRTSSSEVALLSKQSSELFRFGFDKQKERDALMQARQTHSQMQQMHQMQQSRSFIQGSQQSSSEQGASSESLAQRVEQLGEQIGEQQQVQMQQMQMQQQQMRTPSHRISNPNEHDFMADVSKIERSALESQYQAIRLHRNSLIRENGFLKNKVKETNHTQTLMQTLLQNIILEAEIKIGMLNADISCYQQGIEPGHYDPLSQPGALVDGVSGMVLDPLTELDPDHQLEQEIIAQERFDDDSFNLSSLYSVGTEFDLPPTPSMSGLSLGQLQGNTSFSQIANGLAQGLGLFQDLANQYQNYNQYMFAGGASAASSINNSLCNSVNPTPQHSLSQVQGSLSQLSADAAEFFTSASMTSLTSPSMQHNPAQMFLPQLKQPTPATNHTAPHSSNHTASHSSNQHNVPLFQLPNPGPGGPHM